MDINILIGLGRSDSYKKTEKTKRYVKLKTGEANHFILLGKSGYGKTTLMRGLVEEIYIAHKMAKVPALIIVLEKKTDHTKSEQIMAIYEKEKYNSNKKKMKKYGEWVWEYIESYVDLQKKYKKNLGLIGDFSFGVPNIIGKYLLYDKEHTFLGRQGLQPYVFPTRRFVFRPRRELKYIRADNGWHMCNVFEAKIPYSKIPFTLLSKLGSLGEQTLYAQRLKNIWETKGIKDPDEVIDIALSYEKNPDNPSSTYLRIAETMNRLKNDELFSEKDTFFCNLSTDAINIIDFSSNSDLTSEEESLIFKFLVIHTINVASRTRIPIYFVVDEVQNILSTTDGKWAIDKILREGRSMGVNIITATQYMYRLPQSLLMGASHVGIIGRLASHSDWNILSKLIDDFEDSVELPDPVSTYSQYEDLKKRMKFRGWFSWDKSYTERIEFRQPQSL